MEKRLALTKDGKITYCIASEENMGKGRCNHIAHQKLGENTKEFCNRIKNIKENYNKNDKEKNCNNKNYNIKNLDLEEKIKLINSKNVSYEILDTLVNDKNKDVRAEVAFHGRDKDLDILVNDKNEEVRCTVARRGRDKDLNVLVNDKNKDVRWAVAFYGRDKDLDILVNDKDIDVRHAVAFHGRDKDLDILINDKVDYVRSATVKNKNFKYDKRLVNNEGRLKMIKDGCSKKEMDFIRKGPKNKDIKLALIEKGIDVEKFLTDKNEEVQKAAFEKIIEK